MSMFSDSGPVITPDMIGNPAFNPPDLDKTNVVDFGNNNRGAGPPIGDYVYADPNIVIQAGAEHAENAYALLILQGVLTIEDVPVFLQANVQTRVDNPPPSVLQALEDQGGGQAEIDRLEEERLEEIERQADIDRLEH